MLSQDQYYEATTQYLIRESIYESIAFLLVGIVLHWFIPNKLYVFFIIGVGLHIISEYIGIHKIFCKKQCRIETN
jgi:hypothetical protein